MGKFRPSNNCIFVIPDIHGRADELQAILKRILPLRYNKNGKDQIVFLGDYIDRGPKSPDVLEILIDLKTQYKDQIILLLGNHDDLMLRACGYKEQWEDPKKDSAYSIWLRNGGAETILTYAKKAGSDVESIYGLPPERNTSFIEKHHLDFLLNNTKIYYETDDYIFVHGGMNYHIPLKDHEEDTLLWDRSLFDFVSNTDLNVKLPWKKKIVCGHSYMGPVVRDKYIMLDASKHQRLMVCELNSMELFYVGYGNTKMTKY